MLEALRKEIEARERCDTPSETKKHIETQRRTTTEAVHTKIRNKDRHKAKKVNFDTKKIYFNRTLYLNLEYCIRKNSCMMQKKILINITINIIE